MHLIWHIFKKDARLMRGPLTAWVALQLVTFLIAGAISFPPMVETDPGWMDWIGGAHILFLTIAWMCAYFFAGIPVHEDAVSGYEAFWMTRPVARWQLLGAKLFGLAVFFGLLPVLLRLPWWLAHGFSLRETGLAAQETLQASGALAAFALALACLTLTAGQFYRWTLATVIAAVAVAFVFLTFRDNRGSFPLATYASRWPGFVTLLAIPLALVAIGQFLVPNRLRSGLLVGVFLLAGIFSVTIIPVAPYAPRVAADLSAMLTKVAFSDGRGQVVRFSTGLTQPVFLGGTVRIVPKGGSAGQLVTVGKGRLHFGADHGGEIYTDGDFNSLSAAAGSLAQSNRLPAEVGTYQFFAGRRTEIFEIEEATLDATGALWGMEYRLSVPLVEGAEVKDGSRRLRIARLNPGRGDPAAPGSFRGQLVLQETLPALAVDERSRPEGLSEFYFLVTPSGAQRIASDSTSYFASSEVGLRTSFFPFYPEAGALASPAQPGAAAEPVRLVKVGLHRLGTFQTQMPVKLETPKP